MRTGAAAVLVALAFALCAAAAFLVYDHTREDALSADEPIHILSGYFAVAKRSAIVNIEHPPLMKVLSGLALAALPLAPPPDRSPDGEPLRRVRPRLLLSQPRSRRPDPRRGAGSVSRGARRAPAARLLRRPCAVTGRCPRSSRTALLAFDPNLLAHAGVVHTDLGAALMFLATVLAWDAALPAAGRRPR